MWFDAQVAHTHRLLGSGLSVNLANGERSPSKRRMHINGRLDDELEQKQDIADRLRVDVAAVIRIIEGFRER
jgi:hypothetical protein